MVLRPMVAIGVLLREIGTEKTQLVRSCASVLSTVNNWDYKQLIERLE